MISFIDTCIFICVTFYTYILSHRTENDYKGDGMQQEWIDGSVGRKVQLRCFSTVGLWLADIGVSSRRVALRPTERTESICIHEYISLFPNQPIRARRGRGAAIVRDARRRRSAGYFFEGTRNIHSLMRSRPCFFSSSCFFPSRAARRNLAEPPCSDFVSERLRFHQFYGYII